MASCGASWRPARRAALPLAGDCVTAKRGPFLSKKTVKRPGAMSDSLRVRVHADERIALGRLAKSLDEKPSRLVRRLVREAITQGPDFFDDGLTELRAAHRELAAVGRNINQLAKAANKDERVVPAQLKRNLAAAKLQVERLAEIYREAVERSRRRTVKRIA